MSAPPFDIVVTTCKDYAPKTIPALFDTMAHASVPMRSVRIVVGQCTGDDDGDDDGWKCDALARLEASGATVVAVPYGAEALTGVVAVALGDVEVRSPWFALVQDTCLVGPGFAERVAGVLGKLPDDVDVVKLLDKFSLSVGLYRTEWVRAQAPALAEERRWAFDDDSVRRTKMVIEDRAFALADPARTATLGRFDNPSDRLVLGEFRYPGGNLTRAVEYYPALDLYKLKSWMGQSVPTYRTAEGDELLRIPLGL